MAKLIIEMPSDLGPSGVRRFWEVAATCAANQPKTSLMDKLVDTCSDIMLVDNSHKDDASSLITMHTYRPLNLLLEIGELRHYELARSRVVIEP